MLCESAPDMHVAGDAAGGADAVPGRRAGWKRSSDGGWGGTLGGRSGGVGVAGRAGVGGGNLLAMSGTCPFLVSVP
ncbi:hypothetical protein Misp01_81640 [Microtetraspora sp. NBRC 13810]|nr:hypothetical protein Misp01_81640 [Microtetraspora sp. NBRC 13810]